MLRMNRTRYRFSRLIFLTQPLMCRLINKLTLILNRLNMLNFMRRAKRIIRLLISILLFYCLWNLMFTAITRFSSRMWSYNMQLLRSLDIHLYTVNSMLNKNDTLFQVFTLLLDSYLFFIYNLIELYLIQYCKVKIINLYFVY